MTTLGRKELKLQLSQGLCARTRSTRPTLGVATP